MDIRVRSRASLNISGAGNDVKIWLGIWQFIDGHNAVFVDWSALAQRCTGGQRCHATVGYYIFDPHPFVVLYVLAQLQFRRLKSVARLSIKPDKSSVILM